jgi:hypothetical protein
MWVWTTRFYFPQKNLTSCDEQPLLEIEKARSCHHVREMGLNAAGTEFARK